MKHNHSFFLILTLFFLYTTSQAQVNEPTISTCDGNQTICLTQSMYDLCVEIEVDPSFPANTIDYFEIEWDDGDVTTVPGSGNPAAQFHEYDLSDFFGTCTDKTDFNIFVETFLNNGEPSLNNGFKLTFCNLPQAQFNPPPTPCVGSNTTFNANECPNTPDFMIIEWNYGDGNSDTNGEHTYANSGTYNVTLVVENGCGTDDLTQTINVIDTAIADIQVISGVENDMEPFIVCGNQVCLDGAGSQNAVLSTYEWTSDPPGSIAGVGGDPTIDTCVTFAEAGPITIFLEVNNACQNPDVAAIDFDVNDAATLSLAPQATACNSLDYTPSPFNDDAIYEVDGNIVNAFPFPLGPGMHTVQATLPDTDCGDQVRTDTFLVIEEVDAAFSMGDTSLCSGSSSFSLGVIPASLDGSCLLNGDPLPDCLFEPSTAPGNNTITFEGFCINPASVEINVIQTDQLNFDLPLSVCISQPAFPLIGEPEGGTFWINGVNATNFDPQQTGLGIHTVTYEYPFIASANDTCFASITKTIEVFPELFAGFIVSDCNGNTLCFDTINTSAGFTSIEWDFGDNSTSNQLAPCHTYSSPDIYDVTLTITQQGGCEAVFTSTVIVEPPPSAAFSLSATEICSGDSISFFNNTPDTNVTYLWDFGNGVTSDLQNPDPMVFLAPGQDTNFTISLSATNGCGTVTVSANLFVKAGPSPEFFINLDTICSGEALNFNNISANNALFWQWNFGDGTTFDGQQPPPHIYIVEETTAFMIGLTVGNDCDTITYFEEVIVIPSDVMAFLNMGKMEYCSGESIQLINGSGVQGAEFFLSNGNTLFGDTVNFSIITNVDSTIEVTMRVYGCGFDDTTATINVLPAPSLSVTVDPEVCQNQSVQFEVNSDVANILLLFGDGDSTTSTLVSHQYPSDTTYYYTVIATSPAAPQACSNTFTGQVEALSIPTADFIVQDTICAGSETTFTDASSSDVTNWFWDFGNGNITGGNPNPIQTYNAAQEYIATLAVVNGNMCYDTIALPVQVQEIPLPSFTYTQPDPCIQTIFYENTTPNATSFEWIFDEAPNSSTETNPTVTYSTPGEHLTTLIADLFGCSAQADLPLVDVNATPEIGIDFDYVTSPCAPSMVSFTNLSVNFDSLQWSFGDNTFSQQSNPTHTYPETGKFIANLWISNGGCAKDTSLTLLVGVPLEASTDVLENVSCNGGNNGSIEVIINTGNPPYAYGWSDGQDINPAVGLPAGMHQVTVTDSIGCTIVLTDSILEPITALGAVLVELENAACYNEPNGSITVAATGGTPPYSYFWNNQATSSTVDSLLAGIYTVTIQDQAACQFERSIIVEHPDPIQVNFIAQTPPCFGDFGRIEIDSISGGTPYLGNPQYEISANTNFTPVQFVFDSLIAGEYTYFIRDSKGCLDTAVVSLPEPPDWDIFFRFPEFQEIRKCQQIILEPKVTVNGLSYQWLGPNILSDSTLEFIEVQPLETSEYTVFASLGSCVKSASITVPVEQKVEIYVPNAFTPCDLAGNCDNENDYFTIFSNYPCVEEVKSMEIFDRWGTLVFKKENFPHNIEREGWDGTFKGEPMPSGDYKTLIQVQQLDEVRTIRSNLKLIR